MIKNFVLRIVGVTLCLPPILLEPILFFVRKRGSEPWNKGFVGNIIQAYRRYNAYSWLCRIVAILHRPHITMQYLKILATKEVASPMAYYRKVYIDDLIPQHDIYENTKYHQDRVQSYKENKQVSSTFGPIVVLNSKVHDGHHRLAAMKAAGVKTAFVHDYTLLENINFDDEPEVINPSKDDLIVQFPAAKGR